MITHHPGGGFTATGEGVNYVRLASLRAMVRLESKGMKTRGGPLRPRIAAEFGLKPRDAFEKFINAIEARMAKLAPVVQKETT